MSPPAHSISLCWIKAAPMAFTEIWIVPQEDMVKIKNLYNDRLTNNPKLLKAAKLAGEKHFLASNLTLTLKTTIGKTLSTEFHTLNKESRHFSAFGGIGAPAEGEDDEDLATALPPSLCLLFHQLIKGSSPCKTPKRCAKSHSETPLPAPSSSEERKTQLLG